MTYVLLGLAVAGGVVLGACGVVLLYLLTVPESGFDPNDSEIRLW